MRTQHPIIEGGTWRHYKGGLYRVICRSRLESSGVPHVTYQSVETGRIYTRPEHEWTEFVSDPATLATVLRYQRTDDSLPTAILWAEPPDAQMELSFRCLARYEGDQMRCVECGLVWDMNDPEPPHCNEGRPA